jgi:hypothetical protein
LEIAGFVDACREIRRPCATAPRELRKSGRGRAAKGRETRL